MRTGNSIKNSITGVISNFISMFIGFISQAIFIRILGAEYLGLNGLFSNILTVLSIFELGIGNAIVYNLYKPIAENKKDEIKSLMIFYKKSYNIIATLILIFSLLLTPFLDKIVGEITIDINIYVIYIMFIINTVCSYIMTYKRSIIYAYQKNYIVNLINIAYLIIMNFSALIVVYLTKNYYLFLGIKILCQILENFIITLFANKMYPFLLDKNVKPLNKKVEKDIFSKVKALFFHKIGYAVIFGTDNIIISSFLGVITVGLYSNYNMIINSVNSLFGQVINSSTASVGNLLVTESTDKVFSIFKKMRFLNFWLSSFSGICLLVIMQPFIKVWVGEEYLLSMLVLSTLVFNYYQKMMRNSYSTFKDASGIWEEDKFIPLIESILNIVFSIIMLKIFGLAGVFMGTIISGLALWCYSYPKFVYKKLFNRSYIDYAKETLGYIFLFVIIAIITYGASLLCSVDNTYLQIIINAFICLIIPNLLLFILFRKTDNFAYFCELMRNLKKKIVKR